MSTLPLYQFRTMTPMVNEFRNPNSFLRNLYFPSTSEVNLPTETVEIGELSNSRDAAPFVRRGAEARLVKGYEENIRTIALPNVAIKRPVDTNAMFQRHADSDIYADEDGVASNFERHWAREVMLMNQKIDETEEWMVAHMLRGAITYSEADEEVFQITFNRKAGASITVGVAWGGSSSRPLADLDAVKSFASEEESPVPTIGICGANAAAAIREMAEAGHIKPIVTDSGVDAGMLSLAEQYNARGAIYLGTLGGIQLWSYPRSSGLDGSALIRSDYIEFMNPNAALSDRTFYYGAIADLEALQERRFVGARFAKSWVVQDPSARFALIKSRPLPVARKPNALISMKVTNI